MMYVKMTEKIQISKLWLVVGIIGLLIIGMIGSQIFFKNTSKIYSFTDKFTITKTGEFINAISGNVGDCSSHLAETRKIRDFSCGITDFNVNEYYLDKNGRYDSANYIINCECKFNPLQ